MTDTPSNGGTSRQAHRSDVGQRICNHVGDYQERIWEVRSEMEGVGALFSSIGVGADITPEDLFGVSTWIKRLAKELEKLEQDLGEFGSPGRTYEKQ